MEAGNDTGEVFVSKKRGYYSGGGEIFIYHSTDYGEHFTEFHPFSTTVGIKPEEQVQPSQFYICCYPNPFNASTVISFELRAASMVKLDIFDIYGSRGAACCALGSVQDRPLHECVLSPRPPHHHLRK